MNRIMIVSFAAASLLLLGSASAVAGLQNYSQTTFIPHQITTPDKVATPIGTLEFFDFFQDTETTDIYTVAILVSILFEDGERSTIFRSNSEISKKYGKQAVYFFYLHVGWEITRIEIPQWLADNPELLALTHAVAYDQARKGQGYPVSLAEAHERAVIRGPEREQFYRVIEKRYVREGVKVSISRKSFKKRNVTI